MSSARALRIRDWAGLPLPHATAFRDADNWDHVVYEEPTADHADGVNPLRGTPAQHPTQGSTSQNPNYRQLICESQDPLGPSDAPCAAPRRSEVGARSTTPRLSREVVRNLGLTFRQ